MTTGYSLQEVGKRYENFDDGDLLVVVVLMSEVVQSHEGPGIPMQLLNDKRPTRSITFGGDFPSEHVSNALTELRQLVAP